MAQQVIDGILYSPVLAHSLRKGDLIVTGYADTPTARLLANAEHGAGMWGAVCIFATTAGELEFDINMPILRAVGAGAGGLL